VIPSRTFLATAAAALLAVDGIGGSFVQRMQNSDMMMISEMSATSAETVSLLENGAEGHAIVGEGPQRTAFVVDGLPEPARIANIVCGSTTACRLRVSYIAQCTDTNCSSSAATSCVGREASRSICKLRGISAHDGTPNHLGYVNARLTAGLRRAQKKTGTNHYLFGAAHGVQSANQVVSCWDGETLPTPSPSPTSDARHPRVAGRHAAGSRQSGRARRGRCVSRFGVLHRG
jgi:hypothetical protein